MRYILGGCRVRPPVTGGSVPLLARVWVANDFKGLQCAVAPAGSFDRPSQNRHKRYGVLRRDAIDAKAKQLWSLLRGGGNQVLSANR
jgi:hypothetical protein